MRSKRHLIWLGIGVVAVLAVWPRGTRSHTKAHPPVSADISLRPSLDSRENVSAVVEGQSLPTLVLMYEELTGRDVWPKAKPFSERLDQLSGSRLSRWGLIRLAPRLDSGIRYHRDGALRAGELKELVEAALLKSGLAAVPYGPRRFTLVSRPSSGVEFGNDRTR